MEKEEDDIRSLYSALYNALTDRLLIGALLEHPEFQHRGRLICRGIAGQDGGDLFQDACLQVLKRADALNPDEIRSESDFFKWFSALARNLHLDNVRRIAGMRRCTDQVRGWPDASADVSHGEMDEFLAHADVCPYHAALLREEEEEIRAVFRDAGGLDSHGRILQGAELYAVIADYERRYEIWKETALRKGLQVNHISLYNGGKKIGCTSTFFDFNYTKHISHGEFDPRAGLQIRGIIGNAEDDDALLGFYPLAGVRHDGKEKFLHLENGYTVGLRVEKFGERDFEVEFRCVETEVIKDELARTTDGAGSRKPEAPGPVADSHRPHAGGAPFSPPPRVERLPLESTGYLNPPAGWWKTGPAQASLYFMMLFFISVVGVIMLRSVPGQTPDVPAQESGLGQNPVLCSLEQPAPKKGKPARDGAPVLQAPKPKGSLIRNLISLLRETTASKDAGAPARNTTPRKASAGVAAAHSKVDTAVKYYWGALSSADAAHPVKVLHVGTGKILGDVVLNKLAQLNESVRPLKKSDLMVQKPARVAAEYQVSWADFQAVQVEEKRASVIVLVSILDDGVKVADKPCHGEGDDLERAYDDAVGQAFAFIYDGVHDTPGEPQSASAWRGIHEASRGVRTPAGGCGHTNTATGDYGHGGEDCAETNRPTVDASGRAESECGGR